MAKLRKKSATLFSLQCRCDQINASPLVNNITHRLNQNNQCNSSSMSTSRNQEYRSPLNNSSHLTNPSQLTSLSFSYATSLLTSTQLNLCRAISDNLTQRSENAKSSEATSPTPFTLDSNVTLSKAYQPKQTIVKPVEYEKTPGMLHIQKKGFLYRIMDKNTLKHYWYQLRGRCLYMYRSQSDKMHKSFIYLGVDSYMRRVENQQQSEDGIYSVYGFELVTPNKLRKFFHIERKEFQAWFECIRAVTTFKDEFQEKYELKDKLASGNGGSVWRAFRRKDNYPVAIKIIDKQKLTQQQLITLSHEVEIMQTCKHKHIVDCLQVVEEVDYMNIVMEYIEGGTLKEYMMSRKKRITEAVIKHIAQQLLMALYYLKSMSVVHRDIKPENIMLNYAVSNPSDVKTIPSIKLMDFGLSQFMGTSQFSTHPFGTLTYVAPEVISLIPYRFEVDMYSVGVILYQMSSGHVPFDSSDEEKLIDMIQFHTADFSEKAGFVSVSKEAISLISLMLEKEGNLRVTPKQALMSSWFTSLSEETVIRRMKADKDHFRVFTSSE